MATPRFAPLGGRSSRSDDVYVALREALLGGEFTPGEQMREGEIAAQLGVSKTPVREALSSLRARGLLEASATRGIRVATLNQDTVQWLYEVRALLEPEAMLHAGPHIDQKLTTQAHRLLTDAQRLAERRDFKALSKANRDFHELLYQRCENAELRRILNEMRDQMQFAAASGWRGTSPSWDLEHTEHLAILTAIEDGDIK
ncbi:MAG: GntR family transcriptional regulator, partial [Mycobacteriales bacterium]